VGALLKFTYTLDDAHDEPSYLGLSRFVQWRVRPRLEALEGVAQASVHGAAALRVELHPDAAAMLARGTTPDELSHVLAHAQAPSSSGHIHLGSQQGTLRTDARLSIDQLSEIGRSALPTGSGPPVRVEDVARVRLGSAPAVGVARQDGRRAIYLQVDKLPWADTLGVTAEAERVLSALDAELPLGAHREAPVFRQADFVRTSLLSVGRAMLLGGVLVVLVLLSFLRSPRVAFISLTALPLSILAAVVVLLLRGVTIDGMVLGGLAIAVGEVVDDAIVDVENIWRRLQDNARLAVPRPRLEVIHDASVEVRGAVVYASLLVVAVLLPVLFVGGLTGRIFAPLAQAYALAVLCSLGVALTVTPALSALLLRVQPGAAEGEGARGDTALSRTAHRVYERVLSSVARRPGRVFAFSVGLGLLGLAAMPLIGGGFLPEFREGVLIAEVSAWPGTSLEETTRLTERLMTRLRGAGGVPHVSARVGRASLDEDAAPVHRAELDLVLPQDAGEPEEVAAELMQRMAAVPGVRFNVDGFLGERINELLSGERAPIAVKLYGDDLQALRTTAASVRAELAGVPGVSAARCQNLVDVPTTDARLASADLSRLGAQRSDVAHVLSASRQGLPLASLVADRGFHVPLVLAHPAVSAGLTRLDDLPIWDAEGEAWPLSSVARLVPGEEPAQVDHEQGRRVMSVTAQVVPGALSSVASRIRALMSARRWTPGVTWKLAGQAAERSHATRRLLLLSALVLVAAFALLWMAFRSGRDALVVLGSLPLGLLGGVVAAVLLPDGLSMAALVGFVTLAGIISRNGIMLVAHKNQLLREAPSADVESVVLRAARERLRPILMTASTALLGLLPLALSMEAAGSELEAPMALIVCAGLVTSTALNLVALPAFYLWRARVARGASA